MSSLFAMQESINLVFKQHNKAVYRIYTIIMGNYMGNEEEKKT